MNGAGAMKRFFRKHGFWVFYFAFLGLASVFGARESAFDLTGPGAAGKAVLLVVFFGFLAFSLHAHRREIFFRTLGEFYRRWWGWQIGMDLYISGDRTRRDLDGGRVGSRPPSLADSRVHFREPGDPALSDPEFRGDLWGAGGLATGCVPSIGSFFRQADRQGFMSRHRRRYSRRKNRY